MAKQIMILGVSLVTILTIIGVIVGASLEGPIPVTIFLQFSLIGAIVGGLVAFFSGLILVMIVSKFLIKRE